MKLGIINSAFDQAGVDTVTGLEHIARIGFDCVDLFTEATTLAEHEIRTIESTCGRLGLPVVSLPVVACGLVDFNAPVRAYHVQRVQAFSDLAHRLEARNILLVLGEYIWQREVIPPQAQWGLGRGDRSANWNPRGRTRPGSRFRAGTFPAQSAQRCRQDGSVHR